MKVSALTCSRLARIREIAVKKIKKSRRHPASKDQLGTACPVAAVGNGRVILEWLHRHPLPEHARRSAAEIDRDILEMRESWGDKDESE